MEKSRLWPLLQSLTPSEVRKLRDFVASPYFNKRPEVVRLLDALLPVGDTPPAKTAVFPLVFPQQSYSDHRLRQAISFLYRLSLNFLAVEGFSANTVDQGRYRAEALRQRQLTADGIRELRDTSEALLHQPLRNADYHEDAYRLITKLYQLEFEKMEAGSPAVQTLSDHLDTAYLARKLWQACFLWSHQTVSNKIYDLGLLPDIIRYLETRGIPDDPAVALYYHCFAALSDPQKTGHFRDFVNLLVKNDSYFPHDELRDLYVLAINFCIRQNNAGVTAFRREQFELYREGVGKGYFTADGYLPRYTYLNAVTTALLVHEYEWAEYFTDTYRLQVPVEHRQPLWRFNHARLAYSRGQKDKALETLRDVDFRDLMLQLAAKALQVKIYYELNEHDLLEHHLQALKVFIRRRHELGYHRNHYNNLIRLLRQRLELPPLDRRAREAWRHEVEKTAELAEKEWLLSLN